MDTLGAYTWTAVRSDGSVVTEYSEANERQSIEVVGDGVQEVHLQPRPTHAASHRYVVIRPGAAAWLKDVTRTFDYNIDTGETSERTPIDRIGLTPPSGGTVYLHMYGDGSIVVTTEAEA